MGYYYDDDYYYCVSSEGNIYAEDLEYYNDQRDWVINYPWTSPRIVVKEVKDSLPDITEAAVKNIVNNVLQNTNVSALNNDVHYATSDEDEPLTLEEVDDILK